MAGGGDGDGKAFGKGVMPILCLNCSSQPGELITRQSPSFPTVDRKCWAFSLIAESVTGTPCFLLLLTQFATARSIGDLKRIFETGLRAEVEGIAIGCTEELVAFGQGSVM